MDVVEVNRSLKPGKSRFGRHSRKWKTPLPWSGFADGKAQNFFWDGLALIRRGETNLTNEPYVTGGNPIIANGTALFNDILGTTQGYVSSGEASTNAPSRTGDGKEFSQITRDSFGQTLDNSTDTNYDYFTGKPKIEGLGYAFLFRNYAAGLGKWTTSDPLGYPDGWNNFAYVNNRVTKSVDLFGFYQWTDDDFMTWYYTGNGVSLSLSEMGLKNRTWLAIEASHHIPSNLKTQIGNKVRSLVDTSMNSGTGTTRYSTSRAYDFEGVVWAMGDGSIYTTSSISYNWTLQSNGGIWEYVYSWNATVQINYSDIFKDPLDIGLEDPRGHAYHYYDTWTINISGTGSILE
jgi:RHS repeat-associated protein